MRREVLKVKNTVGLQAAILYALLYLKFSNSICIRIFSEGILLAQLL